MRRSIGQCTNGGLRACLLADWLPLRQTTCSVVKLGTPATMLRTQSELAQLGLHRMWGQFSVILVGYRTRGKG